MRVLSLLVGLTLGWPCAAAAAIAVQPVPGIVPHLVDIEHAGDGSGRLFLVRQIGQILIYDGAQLLPTPFLDISSLVRFEGERGMLGLAFHPRYRENGFFYVNYTSPAGDGATVIARYHVSSNPNVAEPDSGTILLMEPQPNGYHNGGQVRFGPDGFLYLSLGDGGPTPNGQRLDTILGKLLRIDVDSASPYAIPAGNPFVNTPGARPEIWAHGLRNPWRFTFDRLTGDLFVADVGELMWEEVDFQPAGIGGRNYGWRLMEGQHCFEPSTDCNPGSLTLPVLEYPHHLGCSVTGGFRYRGTLLAGHIGTYFFADVCTGRIWGATADGDGIWKATQLLDTDLAITTFGEDEGGEIYVAQYAFNGQLYRVVSGDSPSPVLTVNSAGSGSGRISSSPAALHCGTICGAQLTNGTVVTLTATPDAGWAFAGWSGDADCADGSVTLSADRTCTATFGPFTDDPLVAGTTFVKAVHVAELRTRIDAVRIAKGPAAYPWTDPTLAAGTTSIKAQHLIDLRLALSEAYTAAGLTPPAYSEPLAPGDVIKAAHIAEIRAAVVLIE